MKYAAEVKYQTFEASSAGTRAVISNPIHQHAAGTLRRLGGDPTNFAARQLTPKIADSADIILTMTREHRDKVLEMTPRAFSKTFTVVEAFRLVTVHSAKSIDELAALRPQISSRDLRDIPDPIGQDPHVFDEVGAEIARLIPPLISLCQNVEQR
jgi:protein-tyrosine phosphatase